MNITEMHLRLTESWKQMRSAADALEPLLRQDEHGLVMDGLLSQLRTVSDWQRRPKGFSGAWLLAERSPEAAELFKRFLADLAWERNPPWLNVMLKDSPWY